MPESEPQDRAVFVRLFIMVPPWMNSLLTSASRRLSRRLTILLLLLLACLAAWLVLLMVRSQQESPNYSEIEDGLWMGGFVHDFPPGTDVVLNLCETKDNCPPGVVCDWQAIPDAAPGPSLDWLRDRVSFVSQQRQAGRTVYVHCAAGVSRSGMVVVAYLMQRNHWSRDQALEFVREKRPQVRPNPAFMELLLEWERLLKPELQ